MKIKIRKKSDMLFIAIGLVFVIVVIYFGSLVMKNNQPKQTACTVEARICPDGSYVGRTGPNCEFEQCPTVTQNKISTDGWKTMDDKDNKVTFLYPEQLSTKYIHAYDWPPKVQVMTGEFSCTEAGSEISRAGRTSKVLVGNNEYCVTKLSEGAAGSIYIQYAYAFPKNGKNVILTFTTRETQCANYDEPSATECLNERESFSMDDIADKMASSLNFNI